MKRFSLISLILAATLLAACRQQSDPTLPDEVSSGSAIEATAESIDTTLSSSGESTEAPIVYSEDQIPEDFRVMAQTRILDYVSEVMSHKS